MLIKSTINQVLAHLGRSISVDKLFIFQRLSFVYMFEYFMCIEGNVMLRSVVPEQLRVMVGWMKPSSWLTFHCFSARFLASLYRYGIVKSSNYTTTLSYKCHVRHIYCIIPYRWFAVLKLHFTFRVQVFSFV